MAESPLPDATLLRERWRGRSTSTTMRTSAASDCAFIFSTRLSRLKRADNAAEDFFNGDSKVQLGAVRMT